MRSGRNSIAVAAAVMLLHAAPVAAQSHRAAREGDADASRISEELAMSIGILGAGLTIGSVVGSVTRGPCEGSLCGVGEVIQGAGIGGLVGLALVPLGVAAIGEAHHARSHLGWAYLGQLVGLAAASPLVVAGWVVRENSRGTDDGVLTAGLVLAGATSFVGAFVAYEIAHRTATPADATSPSTWLLVPRLDVSERFVRASLTLELAF